MKNTILLIATGVILFSFPDINSAQAPDLGTASAFALFTSGGAFDNFGTDTYVTGDVGTDVGAFNAFPTGTLDGQIYVADAVSAQAAADVNTAYLYLTGITYGAVISTSLGNNQILTPNVYCTGAASSLEGDLILDGEGDPDALFIFQIDGLLSATTLSNIILINSASLNNVYWQINGAFNLGDNSVFRGTVVANGAISLMEGSNLYGRGLSSAGAITLHNNIVGPEISVLPVTLISFNAAQCVTEICVDMNWETASESNSDYFLIERSTDGINFKSIGVLDAAGYSSQSLLYVFTDENPENGINYYRLNQFDYNGENEYFPVKKVSVYNSEPVVNIFPNPFASTICIVPDILPQINSMELRMYNIFGIEVLKMSVAEQVTTIDASQLPSGDYLYKFLRNGNVIQSGKLISGL